MANIYGFIKYKRIMKKSDEYIYILKHDKYKIVIIMMISSFYGLIMIHRYLEAKYANHTRFYYSLGKLLPQFF